MSRSPRACINTFSLSCIKFFNVQNTMEFFEFFEFYITYLYSVKFNIEKKEFKKRS
mgnify:CR=1 FL=1